MAYIILSNLQFVLFFVYFYLESFKKIFICDFSISNIIVSYTNIIPNTLDKVADYMEFRVVKG